MLHNEVNTLESKQNQEEQKDDQQNPDHLQVIDRDDDDESPTLYTLKGMVRPPKTTKDKVYIPRFTLADVASGKKTKKPRKGDIFTYDNDLTVNDNELAEAASLTSATEMKEVAPIVKSKYQDGLKKLKTNGLLKDPNKAIRQADSSDLIYTIVSEFNAMIRPGKHAYVSAQGWWNKLFTDIERVGPNEVMLATRNGIPEIFGYQPEQLVKNTKAWNPTITIEKVDKFDLDKTNYFGAGRTHYLRVKPGHFGLGTLDGEAVLFNDGIHIIHGLFSYEGEVNQQNYHIQHGAIQIVRVPTGQLGLFRVGKTFMIVDAKERAYVYLENDFKFYRCVPSNLKLVISGTYQRVTPEVNEEVIVSNNGALDTLDQKPGNKHIFISDPLVRVLAFVSLNKKNVEFPSVEGNIAVPHVYKYRDTHIEIHLNVSYQVNDIQKFIELGLDLRPSLDNVKSYVEKITLTELGKKMDPAKNNNADMETVESELNRTVNAKLAEGGIDLQGLSIRHEIANKSHFRIVPQASALRNQQAFFQREASVNKLKQSRSVDSLATTASEVSANDDGSKNISTSTAHHSL